jgi:hypothetical protein
MGHGGGAAGKWQEALSGAQASCSVVEPLLLAPVVLWSALLAQGVEDGDERGGALGVRSPLITPAPPKVRPSFR